MQTATKRSKPAAMAGEHLEKRAPGKQARSIRRSAQIADAAIDVVAAHGIVGLTHRLVAQKAGVSLASTTYHFETKDAILAEASGLMLGEYIDAFHRAAERIPVGVVDRDALRRFVDKILINAVGRDRSRAVFWGEIMLDVYRHPEKVAIADRWFAELTEAWLPIAEATGSKSARGITRSAIDLAIGLILMATALGLDGGQVDAVLGQGRDPLDVWSQPAHDEATGTGAERQSRKSAETREKILNATVEILIEEGAGAVTHKTVARRAGLTASGPFYHYPTTDGLLAAAQSRLFTISKQRYRQAASEMSDQAFDLDRLIDLTATVLIRDATEFARDNLAFYAIWLEASRKSDIRSMLWPLIKDQHVAWTRTLTRLKGPPPPVHAVFAQCLYIGKLVRLLATGPRTDALASVRAELHHDFRSMLDGTLWI